MAMESHASLSSCQLQVTGWHLLCGLNLVAHASWHSWIAGVIADPGPHWTVGWTAFCVGLGEGALTAGGNAESSSALLQRLSMGMSDGGASDPSCGHGALLHPFQDVLQAPQIVTADVPSRSIPPRIAFLWRCLLPPGTLHPVFNHPNASRVLWIRQSFPVGGGYLMAGGGRVDLQQPIGGEFSSPQVGAMFPQPNRLVGKDAGRKSLHPAVGCLLQPFLSQGTPTSDIPCPGLVRTASQ